MPMEGSAKAAKRDVIKGRYEIIEPLGRGGMGKVFRALDRETGQEVAIKLLLRQWHGNAKVAKRFAREVNAIRKLDHPCIVKILDFKLEGDVMYYTMEYVRGKSLRHWLLSKRTLELSSVVRILCLVARAMDHAHTITIHRDLSPENVMVQKDGNIKLLDFGLAKLEEPGQALTMIGVHVGKLQYIAPEQRTNAAGVDRRADIYPLGVMIYELLTGQLDDRSKPIHAIRHDVPPGMQTVYERATAIKPDDRYQTARDFHDALLAVYKEHQAHERMAGARAVPVAPAGRATNGHGVWDRLRTVLARLGIGRPR